MKVGWKAAVVACAMIFSGLTTGTAAAAEETQCSTPVLTSVSVHLTVPGQWAYHYHVSWCVEEGVIKSATPHVTHEEYSKKCVWMGSVEEWYLPVLDGSGALNAFNMGQFSCKDGNGTDGSFNPWGTITLWPSGASSVLRKGIDDAVVE